VPVAAAYLGEAVTLDPGGRSTDGQPLGFAWTIVGRPEGSAAALASTTTATATFVPDVAGPYRVEVVVSDPGVALPAVVFTFTAYPPLAPLAHRVLDAEYSKALDAIVMVDEAPNALYLHDPVAGTERSVALSLVPTSVSVGPDGLFAAVGHNAYVSYVDLTTMEVLKVLPVAADAFDVVLAGNGFVYVFPRIDQWVAIHCLELSTGAETTSGGYSIRAGTAAKLHPGGAAIYGADNGLSPSDIERYGITGGTAVFQYDSPYHGDYPMCGNLWISEDGARIFTACGYVFRATGTQSTDMTYNGALQGTTAVRQLSHSGAAGEVAVVPRVSGWGGTGHEDEAIQLFEDAFLTQQQVVEVTPFLVAGASHAGHGRFVFHDAAGTRRHVLVQADPAAAMLHDFAVMSF